MCFNMQRSYKVQLRSAIVRQIRRYMGLGLTYELFFFSDETNFGLNTFNLKICNTTCSLNVDYSTALRVGIISILKLLF